MAYGYPTEQLVLDLQHRMHDLFLAVGAPAPRWDESVYRQAILEALKWVEPVGEVRLVDMTSLSYGMTPQPDETLMEVKQVEVTGARGLWVTVPKQLWRFERGAPRWLTLTYPMSAEAVPPQTLRVTGIGRVALAGIADGQSGSPPVWPLTTIMVDVMMVELYAMSVLTERETVFGAPSQTELDEQHSMTFRAQAELRKQAVLFLQSPPPPPPPSSSKSAST